MTIRLWSACSTSWAKEALCAGTRCSLLYFSTTLAMCLQCVYNTCVGLNVEISLWRRASLRCGFGSIFLVILSETLASPSTIDKHTWWSHIAESSPLHSSVAAIFLMARKICPSLLCRCWVTSAGLLCCSLQLNLHFFQLVGSLGGEKLAWLWKGLGIGNGFRNERSLYCGKWWWWWWLSASIWKSRAAMASWGLSWSLLNLKHCADTDWFISEKQIALFQALCSQSLSVALWSVVSS